LFAVRLNVLPPGLVAAALLAAPAVSSGPGDARARAYADPAHGEIFIELTPTDLPAHASHHDVVQPPVAMLRMPASGSLYGFRVEVVDGAGHQLPPALLHHFNLIDPDHRELFLPISRRMIAAGKETGPKRIPWFLFGFPVTRGERVIATAMVYNPTDSSYHDARVRLVLLYTPAGRPWPLFAAEPFQMDVAFPVGDKAFDVPPGRSSRSYEGSPAVPGTIVAIGGHLHEYGTRLEFVDETTGRVIYRGAPRTDSTGDVVGMPVARLYGLFHLGAHIDPSHRYRVSAYYDNPTGDTIPEGGMGVVGGLFVPDRGTTWPATDPSDTLYQQDFRHAMRLVGEHHMSMPMPDHAPRPPRGAAPRTP
jgi:hypothetical protein